MGAPPPVIAERDLEYVCPQRLQASRQPARHRVEERVGRVAEAKDSGGGGGERVWGEGLAQQKAPRATHVGRGLQEGEEGEGREGGGEGAV